MKTWPAFTIMLVLAVVPLRAQEQTAPAEEKVQSELMELEQDVDKTLLREALLLLGRKGLVPPSERPTSNDDRSREAEDTQDLAKYIERKKEAIAERSAELERKKSESLAARKPAEAMQGFRKSMQRRPNQPPKPSDNTDRQELIEEVENASVQVQLLQIQAQMYQQPLQEAINALAEAEFVASTDPTQQEKAEAARKQFEKVKQKYVDLSKRLRLEQSKIGELQQRIGGDQGMWGGMGGMMGGMGGNMGGGFR